MLHEQRIGLPQQSTAFQGTKTLPIKLKPAAVYAWGSYKSRAARLCAG